MSRRSLAEISAGRDPMVFAENVKRHRERNGWSKAKLAQSAGLGFSTIARVEQGLGCTLSVERKLAKTFGTAEGLLWHPRVKLKSWLCSHETDRWQFGSHEEYRQYADRHDLFITGEVPRLDPDVIQDEAERYRLGRAGLATAFYRMTSAVLISGVVRSCVFELFGEVDHAIKEGRFAYYYCVRGAIKVTNGEDVIEVKEDDALTIEAQQPLVLEPLNPIGPTDLPPRFIFVEVEPYRSVGS